MANLNKAYLIILSVLILIPVLLSVGAVAYFCFRISMLAGILSLIICAVIMALAIVAVIVRIKRFK